MALLSKTYIKESILKYIRKNNSEVEDYNNCTNLIKDNVINFDNKVTHEFINHMYKKYVDSKLTMYFYIGSTADKCVELYIRVNDSYQEISTTCVTNALIELPIIVADTTIERLKYKTMLDENNIDIYLEYIDIHQRYNELPKHAKIMEEMRYDPQYKIGI
jgi:hypothetical protein